MSQDIFNILDFTDAGGLLHVNQKDDEITESERKILYLAEQDYLADAVYFQSMENQKSIHQIFIYDNTNNDKFINIKLEEIHKRLWSSEIVPLYFVIDQTEIKIYNAKNRLQIDENGKESISPTDILKFAEQVEVEFEKKKNIYSAYLFQNGSFWETDYFLKKFLKDPLAKESPFEILLSNLKELMKDLLDIENSQENSNQIDDEIANRIVIFCILIKYLEEKKDKDGYSIFTIKGNLFQKKWGVNDFSDLIKKGKLIELLDYLSEKFNGKIFELTKEEKGKILNLSQEKLELISYFVNANYISKDKQFSLWKLYSFRFLPVELISRIYEEFIPYKKGVVYTPPFLVDFLIDECMPLEDYEKFIDGRFKIIDPACGSGIFCVSAYKRLIDWHIINEYKKSGKKIWNKELKIETLTNILRENIFGVDSNLQAVKIAIFSLTLAMLEKLTPMQLWHDFDFEDKNDKKEQKFDDITIRNIKYDNFFNYINTCDTDFDLVIGNPPFIRQNFDIYKKEEFNLAFPNNIPKNLAVLFLDQSIKILKDNGLQCLILPSSAILYNDGAMNYRKQFMQKYFVPQIVDFTHLRRKLFIKDVSTCAFFVKKQKPDKDSQVLHIISNRTTKEENKIFFSFDTYNFHFIPQEVALNQKYVWKANLVGGGRLKWIVNRLSRIAPTIKEFLDEKKENNDWIYMQGYICGNKSKPADYITGNYYIPEKAFTEKGIDYSLIDIETEEKFENISNKKVFTIPQILIKKRISNSGIIPIELIDYSEIDKNIKQEKPFNNILCFRQGIVGIHYDENEADLANVLYKFIYNNNKILSFYSILSGSVALVRRENALGKDDIDNLPYPQTEDEQEDLQLSEVEIIWQEDVFNYYIHQAKTSAKNPMNKELFPKGEKNSKDEKFIIEYADIFTWLMNINYTAVKGKSFITKRITITKSYIAVEFHYCIENTKTEIEYKTETEYKNYFEKQIGRNKKITRIVQYIDYPNNKIYFIKPRQKRFWLKSIADRDGMSCFADFGNNLI